MNNNQGWATLEFIILSPIVIAIIMLLMLITKISLIKLHLSYNLKKTGQMMARNDRHTCNQAKILMKKSFENFATNNLQVLCPILNQNEVELKALYHYESQLPFFDLISRDLETQVYLLR